MLVARNTWEAAISSRIPNNIAYVDLCKAFDSRNNACILERLKSSSLGLGPHTRFEWFLLGRWIRFLKLDAVFSGVQQKSILGLLLFKIFVNELTRVFMWKKLFFADSLTLCMEIRWLDDAQLNQQDLDALYACSVEYAQPINVWKFLVMLTVEDVLTIIYSNGGSSLPVADTVIGLVMLVQNELSTSRQCVMVSATNIRKLWMLRRSLINLTV